MKIRKLLYFPLLGLLALFFRLAQTEYQRVTTLHKQQEYKDGSQQGYYKPPIMLKKYIGIHVISYEL